MSTETPIETIAFAHPSLGNFKGLLISPEVAQFRSIPFARIPARFRQSLIADDLTNEERDATEYGFGCPQVGQSYEPNGGLLPGEKVREFEEFSCLNLTISAPKSCLAGVDKGGKKLPVMVYVHGGGFVEGAGSISGKSSTHRMVQLSIEDGHPLVMVNINYRVNWQGFLASKDLVEDAIAHGESPCNYGLYDQRNAFLWVKKYISGFGGDPDNVTAWGESAGSMSIGFHMCSTIPLFRRAILMSGTPASSPPFGLEIQDQQYLALLAYCGIEKDDPDRLRKLRYDVPMEKLIASIKDLQIVAFLPLPEPSIFPIVPLTSNQADLIRNCTWVEAIVVGDAFWEGYVLLNAQKEVLMEEMIGDFKRALGPINATKILELYDITPGMDKNLFWTQSMTLMGDIYFSHPCHTLATSLATPASSLDNSTPKKIYRYAGALRNQFLGSNHSYVLGHHAVEMTYVFATFTQRMASARQRDISIEFARRWIKFGAGLEPWDQHVAGEGKIAIADARLGWIVRTRAEDEVLGNEDEWGPRRYRKWEIIDEVLNGFGPREKEIVRTRLLLAGRKSSLSDAF